MLEKADVHAKFLLFLTAHAGLRISDALEWDDLDESTRRIHVRSGKGRKARILAMSTSLARATRLYRGLFGPGGPDHTDGKRTTSSKHVYQYASVMTSSSIGQMALTSPPPVRCMARVVRALVIGVRSAHNPAFHHGG
nr:tyrosine-type recombinase/integrase [Deinococcus deserti]